MVSDMSGGEASERRVWARLPEGTRSALVDRLSPADLHTVLLAVARERAARVRAADLVRRWREDRFVRPSASDPRAVAAVEARLWELLPEAFQGVELSPVVPLGTSSALGPVSQNRIVTTMRSAEVLSDATNALAIEAAVRRLRQPAAGEVHLAASHRHLRAQRFPPGWPAHFRLFALVSSARDAGSGSTEARLLIAHLTYWQRVLATLPAATAPRLGYTVLGSPIIRERVADTVLPALAGDRDGAGTVPVVEEPERERGRGYYVDVAVRLTARDDTERELGDGGLTTWTARLTSNAKERCLATCVSTERLAAIAAPT
jgi:hypothetical protein